MAKIRVITQSPIYDGMLLTFKAPCDCTKVDGLRVYYPNATENTNENASRDFVFTDSHGEVLTGLGNLFMANSYVRVILDTVNGYAFLQNADTNSYVEGKFKNIVAGNFETVTGQGDITENNVNVGVFYYAIFGNVIQIKVFTNALSEGEHNLKFVDSNGNLPTFSFYGIVAVQLNGDDATGGNPRVIPATLSTDSWRMDFKIMPGVGSLYLTCSTTLLVAQEM